MTATTASTNSIQIPPFARTCLETAQNAWAAAKTHPFVAALIDGSLESQQFRFYQMQDARYLESFADACSLISVRCPDPDTKLWFIDAARLALVVESQLHAGYGDRLGYTPADIAALTPTPNSLAYQHHLITMAQRGTVLEAVAALTPCPWLYTEIGQMIRPQLEQISEQHPYADWLRTYADPGFVDYTNTLLSRLQALAEQHDDTIQARAKQAFWLSTRYEWMFWQQAWDQQAWLV
jgi:thiaminase/transcriptional activator TenA